ncbi:MAG: hypothetical protein JWO23_1677 [Solirubrobacterales bacterium]|jgi:hypothetical protein|nr:hypothetical protein [Solirubrobacterales bacterium]MCW3024926.1 hypothetical protein [Solirubrobacterales bacterium]
MPLWVWMVLLAALIKLPIAGLLLWVPFRYDESMRAPEAQDSSEEDGGSKALPGGPTDPHPRGPLPRNPRRGPHGDPAPPSPARIRTVVRSRRRVGVAL